MRKSEGKKSPAKDAVRNGLVRNILIGAGIGIAVVVVLLAALSAAVTGGKIPEESMKALASAAGFLGAAVGSAVAIRRHKANRLPMGLAVGAAMFLVSLIGSAFNESTGFLGGISILLLASYVLGSLVGVGLSLRRKSRRRA